jgi:hypothetical protein
MQMIGEFVGAIDPVARVEINCAGIFDQDANVIAIPAPRRHRIERALMVRMHRHRNDHDARATLLRLLDNLRHWRA